MAGKRKVETPPSLVAEGNGAEPVKKESWFMKYARENNLKPASVHIIKQSHYRAYSTGCITLDLAIGQKDPLTGLPGIPEKAIVEIFGRNASCKSATTEGLIKSVLDADPENLVVSVFSEEPDYDRMVSRGIDLDRLIPLECYGREDIIIQTAEANLDIAKKAVTDPAVKLVVIDSIKSLCSVKQYYQKDGEVRELDNEEQLAIRAKLIGNFIDQFKMANRNAILMMTNQVSDRIIMGTQGLYQNPRFTFQTPGGRHKEYECNIRIETVVDPLESEETHALTEQKVLYGWNVSYRVMKNKYLAGTGNRVAKAQFLFNPAGFNRSLEVLNIASYLGIIDRSHSWYTIEGNTIQGAEKAVAFLNERPDLIEAYSKEMLERQDEIFGMPKKKEKKSVKEKLQEVVV